jgi:hypothetical protein
MTIGEDRTMVCWIARNEEGIVMAAVAVDYCTPKTLSEWRAEGRTPELVDFGVGSCVLNRTLPPRASVLSAGGRCAMSDHTKGPWHVRVPTETECQNGAGQYVHAANGEGVAYAQRGVDAPLIAAAPELLDALRKALDVMTINQKVRSPAWGGEATESSAIGKARAAIAKATQPPQPARSEAT